MAYSVTLTQITDRAKLRADMVNSNYWTAANWTDSINDSIAELHDLIVGSYGDDYFLKTATFSTVAGTASYALATIAADFYKLNGVEVNNGSRWVEIKQFMQAERNRYQGNTWTTSNFRGVRYRARGLNLDFTPAPGAIYSMRIMYVPTAALLVSGSDTYDAVNAWHEFVILDVAIKALDAQDRDTQSLERKLARCRDRIIAMAPNRDKGEPQRMVDVTGLVDTWPEDDIDGWI